MLLVFRDLLVRQTFLLPGVLQFMDGGSRSQIEPLYLIGLPECLGQASLPGKIHRR